MASYLPLHFYFRNVDDAEDIDFHDMSGMAWGMISSSAFSDDQSKRLEKFLQDRYKKDTSFDMKHFKKHTGQVDELRDRYDLDPSKPVWGIMAHINWDAVSDSAPMVYETFNEWMNDTIQTIIGIPEVQWVIKIHPAEAWCSAKKNVEFLIKKCFPELPGNIRVLSADENISPLDFLDMIEGGVTVFGTAGLELALSGKPVILAGEAHYGGKGFTYDADSKKHYRELLVQAAHLSRLNAEQIELVKRYAYCYFIQRQIPVSVVAAPNSRWWSFQYDKKELLLEGRDPFIDFICEKIMDGKDFIMSDEQLLLNHKNTGDSA